MPSLLRKSSCPLLIVHASEREFVDSANSEISLGHILLGTDFTSCSDLALNYALDLGKQYQAKLSVVHVNESAKEDEKTAVGKLKQNIEKKLPAETQAGIQIEQIILNGKPNKELVKFAAEKQVDLIVIGSHNIGLLKSLFFGSEAEKIVRLAPCPVLSICESSRQPDK